MAKSTKSLGLPIGLSSAISSLFPRWAIWHEYSAVLRRTARIRTRFSRHQLTGNHSGKDAQASAYTISLAAVITRFAFYVIHLVQS